MSETTETLKKALMFQLKNPDGSVNWMMSVFVWVFSLLILFIIIYFPVKAMKSKFGAIDSPQAQFRVKGSSANLAIVTDKVKSIPIPSNLLTIEGYDVDETLGPNIAVTYLGGGQTQEVWNRFGMAENTSSRPFPVTKISSATNMETLLEALIGPVIMASMTVKLELRGKLTPTQETAFTNIVPNLYNSKYPIDITYVKDDSVDEVYPASPIMKLVYLGGGTLEKQSGLSVGSTYGYLNKDEILVNNVDKISASIIAAGQRAMYANDAKKSTEAVEIFYRIEWDQPANDSVLYWVDRVNKRFQTEGTKSIAYYKQNSAVKLPIMYIQSVKGMASASPDMTKYFIEQPVIAVPQALSSSGLAVIPEMMKTRLNEFYKVAMKRRMDLDATNTSTEPLFEVVTPVKNHPMLAYVLASNATFIEKLDPSVDSVYIYLIGGEKLKIPGRHLLLRLYMTDFLNAISNASKPAAQSATTLGLTLESNIQNTIDTAVQTLQYTNGLTQDPPTLPCPTPAPCPSCPPEKVCPAPEPCPSCPTFDTATMCPSKPVWPLKNPIPATAKSFNIYYTMTKTPAVLAASIAEAVQMRITFAEKPNANLKPVARAGYGANVVGVEYYDPVAKKNVIKNVTFVANNIRKGVDDIYAIIEPYL